MKSAIIAMIFTVCMAIGTGVMAADTDTMTKDELKEAYTRLQSEKDQLESEKTQAESEKKQLKSENAKLKKQIGKLQSEAETEPSTEIIGTQYTDSATVQIVQKALNDAGFDCGAPDGNAGEKTVAAIRDYQKSAGINVNGVITDELLDALGVSDQVSEAAREEAEKADYSADYSYTTLARDPDSYMGTKVQFRGKVLQEGDAGSSHRYIRLAVDSDYDQVLFVTYPSDLVSVHILEDDILTVYGVVCGDYSYTTVMGAEVTLPWVNADIIDTSEVNMS